MRKENIPINLLGCNLQYLAYVLKHKYYVFIECIKMGLWVHAFTHDLSKLTPSEFRGYADYFYIRGRENIEAFNEFQKSWLFHQKRNKHHWDYWVLSNGETIPMPRKFVLQMIADWRAMGKVFGDTANEYYLNNKKDMLLHVETIEIINQVLIK